MASKRSRAWVFTWNNPEDGDREYLMGLETVYIVFQKEEGENKTPHFQGTIYFKTVKSFKQLKTMLPKCHLEPCASVKDSITYCTKEEGRLEGPFEKGERPKQGERNDIHSATEMISGGKRLRDVAEEYPVTFIKYHKGLEKYQAMMEEERNWEMENIVMTGPTLCGKSKFAASFEDAYWKPKGDWWDGYEGQETVVIDDWDHDGKLAYMLNLMDRYPMRVPFKGGFHQFRSRRIIITSNIPFKEWYPEARQAHKDALKRRITKLDERWPVEGSGWVKIHNSNQ